MGNVIHNDIDGQINRILRTLLKISLQFPTGGMPARERPGPPKEDMLKEDEIPEDERNEHFRLLSQHRSSA